MFPYLVSVEYPYSWKQGYTLRYETSEKAFAYANSIERGKPGTEGYADVNVYKLIEEGY